MFGTEMVASNFWITVLELVVLLHLPVFAHENDL